MAYKIEKIIMVCGMNTQLVDSESLIREQDKQRSDITSDPPSPPKWSVDLSCANFSDKNTIIFDDEELVSRLHLSFITSEKEDISMLASGALPYNAPSRFKLTIEAID